MPIVHGTVVRVEVERLPKPSGRTKKTFWLWWSGPGTPDLSRCWQSYLRRFDIEHTFRFMKSTLAGRRPRCATPSRLTAGLGSSSPPTRSCAFRENSSQTSDCPGNGGERSHSSLRHEFAGGFGSCVQPSARPRMHRNRSRRVPGVPREPEDRRELAIQSSGRAA